MSISKTFSCHFYFTHTGGKRYVVIVRTYIVRYDDHYFTQYTFMNYACMVLYLHMLHVHVDFDFYMFAAPMPEPNEGFFAGPAFNFVNSCPSCSAKWSDDQEQLLIGAFVTLFGVFGIYIYIFLMFFIIVHKKSFRLYAQYSFEHNI